MSGCALVPPQVASLEGTHSASLGLNFGTSVMLNRDGTYQRTVSLFYCVPLVAVSDEGKKEESLDGWINTESGTWKISDRVVILEAGDREIQNPNVEKKYFDEVRSYPITYKFPHGWTLIYPSSRCVVMKKRPAEALEPTATAVISPAAQEPPHP
jgi:hypothetical protein